MIGTVTGVSLIAKQLGASRPGQLLAAVAVATLPEGILEASGAMNTYVGAFWIVVAVYYLLRWNARQCWSIAVALGAAVGLAILTKGTAYVFLPFILVAIWWMGSVPARKSLLARLPVFLIIILALNGPLFVRNWRLSASPLGFSSPLGDDAERQYGNSRISPSIAIANVVKNLSLHVATPIGSVNARTQRVIVGTLRRLGMDPSDKASTYRGGFHLNGFSSHEARAGNPLQLALIGLTGLFLFSGKIGNRNLRLYMFGLAASFVLFCALIRWQPWNSRYHLPLFALGMALVGVVLERRWNQVTLFVVACLMLVSALPFALFNSLRPLAPWPRASVFREARLDSYFADSHDRWIDSYVSATKLVESSHCNSVGVDSSLEDFDYPVFALLNAGHTEREVHYAGVRNLTAAYARSGVQTPCVVICLRCANAPAKWAEYKDVGGRASVFDEVVVFSSAGNVANDQTVDLPEPTDVARILKELDGYRDSPRAVNFATTEARIDRAGKDWPLKRADLKARLNALYTGGLTLWRVRDSVDPMRRKGQPVNNARVDPTQLLAASSVFTNWDQTIDGKVDELNQLVDQLYSSWQTTLVTTPSIADDNSAACRVTVRTMRQTLANPALQTKITQTDERSVERADCSCLRNRVNAGELLARKAFGKYDCEVENRTICDMSSSNPADSQITWAPVGNFKTSDVRH